MLSAIEEILRRTMGLEASSIGASTVEQIIRGRMARVGAATIDAYLQRLREVPAELDELIEATVIPETWFFRDGSPFAALAGWAREQWLPVHPVGTLRILTIPCSTGEEPYSVAMALLGAGLPPDRFAVDAVDLSRRALGRAEKAVYGANSFRGQELDFRDRYFTPGPDGFTLASEVRRQVRFEHGNLLASDFRPGHGRFDVIFCRNLLIYFDRATQARAMKTLAAMLAPDGLLFVGHAEAAVAVTAGFTTANYPMSFAFRRAAASLPPPSSCRPPMTPLIPLRSRRIVVPSTLRMTPAKPPATRALSLFTPRLKPGETSRVLPAVNPAPAALGKGEDLRTAQTLADQGKLEEAGRLCEDHLRQNAASTAGWYLLGVVRDAAGDCQRAAECYTKTLYLEPDHQDALLQRALLAERAGDLATAAQLRRRIARVQERSVRE